MKHICFPSLRPSTPFQSSPLPFNFFSSWLLFISNSQDLFTLLVPPTLSMRQASVSALLSFALLAIQVKSGLTSILPRDDPPPTPEFLLALCPGAPKYFEGDQTTCVFTANSDPIKKVYGYTYSQTGSNCNAGSRPFKTSIGLSETIDNTWSTTESVGAGVDGGEEVPIGISVSVETSQDHGESVRHDNTIDYQVPVNKQSAMVSQQGYNRSGGKLTVTVKNGPISGHNSWDISPFYQDSPDASDVNTSPRDFDCNQSIYDLINGYNQDPNTKQW